MGFDRATLYTLHYKAWRFRQGSANNVRNESVQVLDRVEYFVLVSTRRIARNELTNEASQEELGANDHGR